MPQIELSAGTIDYADTGHGGPVIVLLHGLLMDATVWDEVTAALAPGHRCVARPDREAAAAAVRAGHAAAAAPAAAAAAGRVRLADQTRRCRDRPLRTVFADKRLLVRAAESLPAFDRPALVVWAAGDRVMPPEHGRRLAGLLPDSSLIEIPDSYTLIPLDQPAVLAAAIRDFAGRS
jgi:pimeloyl-ACP methyl ester carboxylesterase